MSRRFLTRTLAAAALSGALFAATAEAARVYVAVAPPVPVVEVRTVAPGPHHVWVPGYHRWDGHAYVWSTGHWVVPPRAGVVWVEPHWVHHKVHGWYFVEGRWK